MSNCENCKNSHDAAYGSGRFCSSKCARGFSSKAKRQEINKKVSASLKGRNGHDGKGQKVIHFTKQCLCGKEFDVVIRTQNRIFCNQKCRRSFPISESEREARSITATKRIIDGKTFLKSIKCTFSFNNEKIRCDSKLEYVCLDWFCRYFQVKNIQRVIQPIKYEMNGDKKRYVPDFVVETSTRTFMIECKTSTTKSVTMNEKWHNYIEQIPFKRHALIEFCVQNNFEPFWFTVNLHSEFYRLFHPMPYDATGVAEPLSRV